MVDTLSPDLPEKASPTSSDSILIADAAATPGTISTKRYLLSSADARWASFATGAAAAVKANNLSDLANASTARTNLGLGTAATTASTAYATSAQGTTADNALAKASNLSDLTNAVTARTSLGLGTAATTAATAYATAAQGTLAASALQTGTSQSNITNLVTDLAAKQGLNSRLTTISNQANPATAKLPQLNTDGTISFIDVPSGGGGTFYYCIASRATTQSISSATFTTVILTTTSGNITYNTTTGIFNVPVNGIYQFISKVRPADGFGTASYGQSVGTANTDTPDFIWARGAGSGGVDRNGLLNVIIRDCLTTDDLRLFAYCDIAVNLVSSSLSIIKVG